MRDAAIHRVPRDPYGGCGSLTGSQWIATGYALAMTTRYLRQTKVLRYTTLVSLRGGSVSEGRGNPSCLEGRVRRVRFVYWFTVDRHGLRPRDDKGGLGSGWLTLDQIGAFT